MITHIHHKNAEAVSGGETTIFLLRGRVFGEFALANFIIPCKVIGIYGSTRFVCPTSGVVARVAGGSGGMLLQENFELYSLANAFFRVFRIMKLFLL